MAYTRDQMLAIAVDDQLANSNAGQHLMNIAGGTETQSAISTLAMLQQVFIAAVASAGYISAAEIMATMGTGGPAMAQVMRGSRSPQLARDMASGLVNKVVADLPPPEPDGPQAVPLAAGQ